MFLAARSAVPEDLPPAFPIFEERFFIPKAYRQDLLKMWGQILQEACCYAPVVEDLDRDEGDRIAAIGLSFCVPEDVLEYARHEAPPYLWRWTLDRWKHGRATWLDRKEARKLQREGRAAFFGFNGFKRAAYSKLEQAKVTDLFTTVIAREASQQRARYHLTEAFGPAIRDRQMAHGMRVLSDYRGRGTDAKFWALPEEQRPFLMIADMQRAAKEADERSSVGRLALLGPPFFAFSDAEQEVMKWALRSLTDQAIAEKLGLSLVAIKKRWGSIYEKVAERSLLKPRMGTEEGESPAKVGRRRVLQMMAEHPEEFWPSQPKKRVSR
jgi:DNA-binding CsgD family transcriptional regulator